MYILRIKIEKILFKAIDNYLLCDKIFISYMWDRGKMKSFKTLKYACYTTNVTMSIVGNLSPLLFLTFRELYGISYSLLGLLVLINFSTQLIIDLIFSFFSHRFNIPMAVRLTPALAALGLLIYALMPLFFPENAYLWIALGTVIFSAASGFAEVLISPVIAAIPSDDPDREMSKLHSIYAWGVFFMIIFASTFLFLLGRESWHYLALILMCVPILSALFFTRSEIPEMKTPEKASGALSMLRDRRLLACVLAIFLGGAAECTMAQWSSGYLENALGIPKTMGDIFGVALFGLTLGIGRTMYAKHGKNIGKVLIFCAVSTSVCYLTAAVSNIPIIGLIACAMTGFCTSMMWPGNLIVMEHRFPSAGVFLYALMAAGGDLGASIGPQLVGLITDFSIANPTISELAVSLSLSPDQLGMKLGLLIGMLFPLCAIPLFIKIYRTDSAKNNNQETK